MPSTSAPAADALVERLSAAFAGALDLACIYIGHRLGLYEELQRGARTPGALAAALGLDERYVREWLEQQAVTGLLGVDDDAAPEAERSYHLPEPHAEVLLDQDSRRFSAPNGRALVSMIDALPDVLDAFRTGGGVRYARYGNDLRESVSAWARATYPNVLGSEWLPAMPDIDARLRAAPPARVADVACGSGWSTLSIARAYPTVTVDGLDLDAESIEAARATLHGSGLEDRVAFAVRDAADPNLTGRYDLVTIFEALHDLSDPVGALRAARALLSPGGVVLVGDGKTAETFRAPGDESERVRYGCSVLHCLPVGMANQPSAGTGTVMRPGTVRAYARAAGFARVDVLPVDDDAWRFYQLTP